MKRANLILMGVSLCFGTAVFVFTWSVARESRAAVQQLEQDLNR